MLGKCLTKVEKMKTNFSFTAEKLEIIIGANLGFIKPQPAARFLRRLIKNWEECGHKST
jgi:hypothetical protein